MSQINHILSVDQFSVKDIANICEIAKGYSNPNRDILVDSLKYPLRNKLVANLFYEPSTRTSSSFFAAVTRLGGSVLSINEVKYSSVAKGESLKDTIISLGCYVDAIVLRHNQKGAALEAASVSNVPIINAGDGDGEHPTQALLDLYTIFVEKKQLANIKNLQVGLMGDLKYGRTVHSLTKLLRMYGVDFHFIAPEEFQIPYEFRQVGDSFHNNIESIIPELDVLYVTRVQKERHGTSIDFNYMITPDTLVNAKSDLTIMHPLPRVGEISEEVDADPRAAYFRQMKNGLWTRMALMHCVLTK